MNNYLLDAVDRLTLKHITKVTQEADGLSWITDIDHDPLLVQLREAVVGGIGSHAGSSPARERIPFDAGALALFDTIAARVNTWYLELPNPTEERLIQDRLRDWYVDHENKRRGGKLSDVAEKDVLKLVEGWARSIEAMFDPPITLELTSPCPVCGERYAHDPKTGDQITAVILEYRNIGTETLDKATGLCRFCTTVWRGRSALRELRWAVDHAEEDTTTTAA